MVLSEKTLYSLGRRCVYIFNRWKAKKEIPVKSAPHRVLFLFGELYPGVECVVRQVKARYFHLFDRDNLRPQHAEVDVVLEEYIDESVGYGEVRG